MEGQDQSKVSKGRLKQFQDPCAPPACNQNTSAARVPTADGQDVDLQVCGTEMLVDTQADPRADSRHADRQTLESSRQT